MQAIWLGAAGASEKFRAFLLVLKMNILDGDRALAIKELTEPYVPSERST